MKSILFTLLFVFALSSFATRGQDSDFVVQTPEELFSFQEGISHATFVYKDQKNIQAVVEVEK